MKTIKYKFLVAEINGEKILLEKTTSCKTQEIFDLNYPLALAEAIGEIEIQGEFEIEPPTQLDRIEAQTTYTAIITDSLLPEVKEEI